MVLNRRHTTLLLGGVIASVIGSLFFLLSHRRSPPESVTLNYLRTGWIRPSEVPTTEALSRKFYEASGLHLRQLNGVQEETFDQLTLTSSLLHEGNSSPDVLEIDVTWLGVLRDDLLDLRQYLEPETRSIDPGLVSNYSLHGNVLAIPMNINGGMLAYRSDLLRRYGYAHPPKTWQELEKVAWRIQQGERTRGNKNFWGYVWSGADAESLTCNALEWQMSDGGGSIIEANHTVSVNNTLVIRAWERARHWIGWISPPSTTGYKENDVHDALDSGRAAFVRVWGGEVGTSLRSGEPLQLHYAGDHLSIGEVAFTNLPAGNFASVSVLGGSGLAISRYSPHPQEDAQLIRFLLHEQSRLVQEGVSPDLSRMAVRYDVGPYTTIGGDTPGAGTSFMVGRPSTLANQSYNQVTNAYFNAVHSVLTGEKPATQAAAQLEKALVDITGFPPGPVRHPERSGAGITNDLLKAHRHN